MSTRFGADCRSFVITSVAITQHHIAFVIVSDNTEMLDGRSILSTSCSTKAQDININIINVNILPPGGREQERCEGSPEVDLGKNL